ncbi:MAG: hypothetical protein VYD68_05735 [Pseudomonadota bacterium]|nr:hypothetical protein [Pseudomonadota bacterium]MEC9191617.1 hypothetical protein [Pseudomonadota bacterium]
MKNIVFFKLVIAVWAVVSSFAAQAKISDEIKALNVPIPYRDASMMEGAVALRSAVVAVEYADRKMQKRMFSRRIDKNFYPVLIRVTNDSDQRLLVKAPDTHLISQNDKFEPEQIHRVFNGLIKTGKTGRALGSIVTLGISNLVGSNNAVMVQYDSEINEPLVQNMYNKSLKFSIVESGDTVSGFLFFAKKAGKGKKIELSLPLQYLNSVETFVAEVPLI